MLSFVYFDLGGVVVKDFTGTNKWQELKNEMGITSDMDADFNKLWAQHERQYTVGKKVDDFLPILTSELGIKLPKNYSLLMAFATRFEPNPSLWPVIERIHDTCRVGLLTNMYPGLRQALQKRGVLPEIQFDVVIDSSLEVTQKPEIKMFQIAQEKAGVGPGEILFVENDPNNAAAAQKLGWSTFVYDSKNTELSSRKLQETFNSLRKI